MQARKENVEDLNQIHGGKIYNLGILMWFDQSQLSDNVMLPRFGKLLIKFVQTTALMIIIITSAQLFFKSTLGYTVHHHHTSFQRQSVLSIRFKLLNKLSRVQDTSLPAFT